MINNDNILTIDSISVLYGKDMICTYHWLQLKQATVDINYYSKSGKNKRLIGTLKQSVHICEECETAFITRDEFELLNERLGKFYIKFKGNINQVSRFIKNDLDENSLSRYELSTYGYSANMPRKNRWNILINRVIPTIGINNTIEQIRNFINYNIIANGKEKSLEEWQFDLDRLKDLDIYENSIN